MILKELVDLLPLISVNDVSLERKVQGVYIGDLLSFVMANGQENELWLTVQRHLNVVAVAELTGFSAIVFVQDIEPETETINKANELSIPLLKTSLTAYELTKALVKVGL